MLLSSSIYQILADRIPSGASQANIPVGVNSQSLPKIKLPVEFASLFKKVGVSGIGNPIESRQTQSLSKYSVDKSVSSAPADNGDNIVSTPHYPN